MKLIYYLFFTFIMIMLAISVSSTNVECAKDISFNHDVNALNITTIALSVVLLIFTAVVTYYNYNGHFNSKDSNGTLYFYLFFVGVVTILSFVTSIELIKCYQSINKNDKFGLPGFNMPFTFIFFIYTIYLGLHPPSTLNISEINAGDG